MYDKNWTFDDSNDFESDGTTERGLQIGYANFNAGEPDIPFAAELLIVKKVYGKDSNGVYQELEEETDPENTFLTPSGNVGYPTKFRLLGASILLDFIPNVDVEDGIKVIFTRNGSKFKSTDTTKQPGIPSLFHPWISQVASLPFVMKHRPQEYAALLNEVEKKKDPRRMDSIPSFLSNRNQTRKPRLNIRQEDTR